MNLTLIFSIAVILILMIVGRHKGFIKTIFMLFSSIIVFFLTCMASPYVTELIVSSDTIYDFVYDKVEIEPDDDLDDRKSCREYIESLNLPSVLEEKLVSLSDSFFESASEKTRSCEEFMTDKITVMILSSCAFVVTYILLFLLVSLVGKALNLIAKLPVLNFANKTLGLVAGLFGGVMLVMIFMSVVSFITATSFGGAVMEDIESSSVLSFVYDHNFFASLVSHFTKL